MAAPKTSKMDAYANLAAVAVSESAADTLATTKFAFPFSIMDKVGLLISRIEYWFNTLGAMNSTTDSQYMALLAASTVVDITAQNDPLIVDTVRLTRIDFGTAASANLYEMPVVRDFSMMPGGGILVAPNPLYGALKGAGESGASSGWVRLYYTYMELSTDDYWQLVESRRIISS